MTKTLLDRFVRLGRDEDGVALVFTLGAFMFIYVACASVYAVGMAVKEKLHLQGACDAAAYSAAIVQADTLSRIATVNRAMSWTYQQMTKRQMDYIVWQWLEETIDHYDDDVAAARKYVEDHLSDKCPNRAILKEIGWGVVGNRIKFNDGDKARTRDRLVELCGNGCFGQHLKDNKASFYSQHGNNLLGNGGKSCGLGKQIDDDLRNIRDMSAAVENLANSLPGHVNDAVHGILVANVPSYMSNGDCQYFVQQSQDPLVEYFESFPNDQYHELVFLSLGNKIYANALEAFGKGIKEWFVLDSGKWGFRRHYPRDRASGALVSKWEWWAIDWQCMWDPVSKRHFDVRANVATEADCKHGHDRCRCSKGGQYAMPSSYGGLRVPGPPGSTVRATCRANNNGIHGYDNRFEGVVDGERTPVRARPLKLTRKYFGKAGTITVVLARRNENPWFSLFGRVTGGMYSAFSPVSNSWSYCFASAKAGYKLYHEPDDYYMYVHFGSNRSTLRLDRWEEELNGNVRVANGPRDYCVDWKEEQSKFAGWYWTDDKRDELVTEWTVPSELYPTWRQSWNLVQDDWDAVMVPVRQGGSLAQEVSNYSLLDWWRNRLSGQYDNVGDIPDRHEPAWQVRDDGYIGDLVKSAGWRVLSGGDVPNTDVTAGATAIGAFRWNIENPGAGLDWRQIGDEMYH